MAPPPQLCEPLQHKLTLDGPLALLSEPTLTTPAKATEEPEESAEGELEAPLLAPRVRNWISVVLVGLAITHVVVPTLAIDAIFLGLLAFAAFIQLFDIESVEWLGLKAKRRRIEREAARVRRLPVPTESSPVPLVPPQLSANPPMSLSGVFEEHEPSDLTPPVDRLERLLWCAEQIRIELVVLAGNAGRLPPGRSWDRYPSRELSGLLRNAEIVPDALLDPIASVVDLRNRAAHSRLKDPSLLESASTLGIEVVSRLREIPRTYHRVVAYPVGLYTDRSLTTRHSLSIGVRLEQRNKDGHVLGGGVYPSRQRYKPGSYVTWEWELETGSDLEAWYKDEDGLPKLAFTSSATFVGRTYPRQWGVEFRAGGPLD